MSIDDNTLAGTPSPDAAETPSVECDSDAAEKGERTVAGFPGMETPHVVRDDGESAPPPSTESASSDVGFKPIEPFGETPEKSDEGLSGWYRETIAKCIIDLGNIHQELDRLNHAAPSMKRVLKRAASVETASRICKVTEKEIERKENTDGQ